jgi:hypothetical protein
MDCTICNEIKEDVPTIELLCEHTFHTECWLRRSGGAGTLGGLRCATCNAFVIPDELHAEIEIGNNQENTTTDIVKIMWAENEDFKKFLLESMKKWKNHKKSSTILNKKANELLKNEELLEYKQIIKAKLAELHKELMESPEYKEAMRNQRINMAVGTTLNRVWGVTGWDVRHALKEEPEIQTYIKGRVWTHRLARVMGKFKYYRIK